MSQRQFAQSYPAAYESGGQFSATSTPQQPYRSSPSEQRTGQLPPPPPTSRGFELPPLSRVHGGRSGSASPPPSIPRSTALPSVLNPVSENGMGQRRRKADEMSSPRDSVTTLPPLLNATPPPGSVGSSVPAHVSESADRSGRKLLTPQSPFRRAISLSNLNPANGNMNAQQNPFPGSPRSQPYTFETKTSGAQAMPTPQTQMRQGTYGFPSIVPPPTDLPRRPSPESKRYSASPSPGYSPYDENSPTGYSAYDQGRSGYLGVGSHSRNPSRGMSVPAPGGSTGSQLAVPVTSSTGQSTYQMMTLKTSEGDVRFPVDVQAASRVADEKRKRNAGASARFRERRKKKEMEAASTISKLEQQVKDVSEDADFYKKERDVLAGIIRGMSGGDLQLSNRPPSPRARRHASNPSLSTQAESSNSYNTSTETSIGGSPDIGRRVRRRTSSFPMAQEPATVPQAFGQSAHQLQQQNYVPPHMSGTHQHMPSSLPQTGSANVLPSASHMASYSGGPTAMSLPPPPVMPAPPMTGPYNPFASRYDQQRTSHGR